MPPLSVMELLAGLVCAAITRAILVGFAVWFAMFLWPGVNVTVSHWWAVIWFGFMGSAMLALLGVLTSIWAEKFDELPDEAFGLQDRINAKIVQALKAQRHYYF